MAHVARKVVQPRQPSLIQESVHRLRQMRRKSAGERLQRPFPALPGSVATHCRKEDLVVQAAEAAANTGAAAGGPDHTVYKGGPVDTVNGKWHVAEAYPLVGPRIVVVMVGEHA